jgi:hypothetical protein
VKHFVHVTLTGVDQTTLNYVKVVQPQFDQLYESVLQFSIEPHVTLVSTLSQIQRSA